MEKKELTIPAFTTLNTAKAKGNLGLGECCTLVNYYPKDGKLRIRPRMDIEDNDGWTSSDNGVNDARSITGLQQILVSGSLHTITLERQGFSTGYTALTDLMTLSLADSAALWRSVHLNGRGYAVRSDLTSIVAFDDADFWSVGIAAPTTNAIVSTSATAGAVEVGLYQAVYTFVDANGVESAPSPVSSYWTQGASKQVDWTSVDVSTNPRIVARNLYRTLPGQTGEYFYVGQIPDNAATTFTENTTVPEMGDLAPVNNLVPPTVNYVDVTTWVERIWVTDGEMVYGSLAEDPDSFDPENTYQFSPDDGQKIVAIRRCGPRLLVFKRGSIWALEQSLGAFEFVPRLVDGVNGVTSPEAIAVGGDTAYFFNGKALCATDGVNPTRNISAGNIREFGEVDSSVVANVAGGFHGSLNWAVFSIPTDTTGTRRTFVYQIDNKSWFEMSWGVSVYGFVAGAPPDINLGYFQHPRLMHSVVDSTGGWGLIAVAGTASAPTDTFVFYAKIVESTFSSRTGGVTHQDGTAPTLTAYALAQDIAQTVRWATQMGAPGRYHIFDRLELCTNNPAQISADADRTLLATAALYFDEETSASKTRTNLVVVGTRKWKTIKLSSGREKATLTEIEITRSSIHELIIEAARLHGAVWNQNPVELP